MLSVFGEQQMRLSTEHTIHLAISAAENSQSSTPQPEAATLISRPTPAVRSSPLLTEAEMQRRIQAHYQRRSQTPQHIPPAGPRPAPISTTEHRTQEAVNIIATAMQPTWLLNIARQLERGLMIFLASLAPGLAEGHIANVEAEEERRRAVERRRAEEEEAKKKEAEEKEKAKIELGEQEQGDEAAVNNHGTKKADGTSSLEPMEGSTTDATTVVNQDAQAPEITV
ncbi:hypothetical protein CFO_g1521 [Ceratocystis platani]|uniref:Uncharacterized protein n=1 Tax=Ceratocystis fimbriata f. sp. platani TaxID=88771 RepID=A0A0F8DJR0_CERFI|nr:hypothetical protein CFO_g1521 [Ceratocystis platani]